MAETFGRDGFEEQVDALGDSISATSAMAAAFSQELNTMQATIHDTARDVGRLQSSISSGLRRAIDGSVLTATSCRMFFEISENPWWMRLMPRR